MSDNKFWVTLWSLGASVLVVLIICITVTKVTDSNNITRLVLNGATPTQAYCAVNPGIDNARCVVATIGGFR